MDPFEHDYDLFQISVNSKDSCVTRNFPVSNWHNHKHTSEEEHFCEILVVISKILQETFHHLVVIFLLLLVVISLSKSIRENYKWFILHSASLNLLWFIVHEANLFLPISYDRIVVMNYIGKLSGGSVKQSRDL